jgi:hypothetical protein
LLLFIQTDRVHLSVFVAVPVVLDKYVLAIS